MGQVSKRIRKCPPPGQQLGPGLLRCTVCGMYFPPASLPNHRANSTCGRVPNPAQRPTALRISQEQAALPSPPAPASENAEATAESVQLEEGVVEGRRAVHLSALAASVRASRSLASSKPHPCTADEEDSSSPVVAAVAAACTALHHEHKDRLLHHISIPLALPWDSAAAFDKAMLDDGQVLELICSGMRI